MKQELRRTEGNKVFAGPWAWQSRGLQRRRLPGWMQKRFASHTLPSRPVRGSRAYAAPAQPDVADFESMTVQPLVETLILPGSIPFRKYLQQRLLLFSLTDSISVRRLAEVSSKRQGVYITVGACAVVLLGLLLAACAGYFHILDGQELANSTRSPIVVKQTTSGEAQPTASKVELPVGTGSAKAGSITQSEKEHTPALVVDLDERQRILESAVEQTILAMRKAGADSEKYVRENEVAILDLQHDVQELISIRNGRGSGRSPQSLALSRSLASVHLLIGQHQAARNLLLDLQDATSLTRSKDDPEMRLLEHLLRLIESASLGINDGSATIKSPLTPGEMKALLMEF